MVELVVGMVFCDCWSGECVECRFIFIFCYIFGMVTECKVIVLCLVDEVPLRGDSVEKV